MPREKQKRGRRAEKSKRKREDEEAEPDSPKRQRTANEEENQVIAGADYIPLDTRDNEQEQEQEQGHGQEQEDDTPFYGLLDTEEQEYFSKASQTLELNSFEDDDDKRLFIESVYEEAKGKELKIACSQSCSRLMEKLIGMSTPVQVKALFEKFTGHFLHLVQHRFASHCCECLFIRAAPIVTSEIEKPKDKKKKVKLTNNEDGDMEQEGSQTQKSATDLFLGVISELQGNWGYLLTESFASHTIRVLLLILAGEPLADQSNARVLASRKKENLDSITVATQSEQSVRENREVPVEFNKTLKKMITDLSAGLNSTYLQALATHPVGSPVLQVVLSIELGHIGKEKIKDTNSVFRRLIPDDTLETKEEGVDFLNGLFYDPVGSRLLETIVRVAPGKFFKTFYKQIVRERIGSLARNEIASYVVIKVLERVSKEDLQSAIESILPEIPSLVQRSRLNVIKTLIDRSTVRGADTTSLAKALESAYGDDSVVRLRTLLLGVDTENQTTEDTTKPKASASPQHLHGSLLAQSMLQAPGALTLMIQSGFIAAPSETIMEIAKHSTASRALQEALKCSKSNTQFRRQFLPRFYGQMSELALDSSGSHVADALWNATTDLIFIKQRLAQELENNESALRDSFLGRAVWRNWSMDLYKRKRGEWMSRAKGQDSTMSASTADLSAAPAKSKLDLARARYAARAEQQEKPDSREQGSRGKKQTMSAPNDLLKAQ
ncbi:glutamate decarboxylase 1 [Arthroderma uncinatum]|uniref:glutamate decarboxylase 1 n=1 Tax=Arthroderma uncinatum TaxID=74035 RepID=UPI00144AF47D|nr:glutamate decarboxylase 1 [Arthroderma uncinatum]KAF3491476.1 glutamate decarboxylase 1 [Arthroderma uncinatum]